MTKSTFIKFGAFAVALLLAYFANVAYQTHLGERALAETGLVSLELEDAIQRATDENKLVLSDLSAIWCPSCRKLDQTVFSDPMVQKTIEADFVFSRIEYESNEGEAFMKKYDARGFPTLIVIDPKTDKAIKLPLTFSPTEFIEALKKAS